MSTTVGSGVGLTVATDVVDRLFATAQPVGSARAGRRDRRRGRRRSTGTRVAPEVVDTDEDTIRWRMVEGVLTIALARVDPLSCSVPAALAVDVRAHSRADPIASRLLAWNLGRGNFSTEFAADTVQRRGSRTGPVGGSARGGPRLWDSAGGGFASFGRENRAAPRSHRNPRTTGRAGRTCGTAGGDPGRRRTRRRNRRSPACQWPGCGPH